MKIEDSFTVDAPIEQVYRAITDPDTVAPCVPGCEGVEVLGPTTYRAAIQVQVGPIKARFNLDVEVTDEEPPSKVMSTTKGEEGGRASNVRAENVLLLSTATDGKTEVHYSSEVSVTGRLAKFGLGVMKKKAKALGAEFAEAFKAEVEAGAGLEEKAGA